MDCPLQDSKLRVHYKGMLLDDKKTIFYNTRDDNDGQPLEFCSGEGLVSFSNTHIYVLYKTKVLKIEENIYFEDFYKLTMSAVCCNDMNLSFTNFSVFIVFLYGFIE